jgi:hypothetical protein
MLNISSPMHIKLATFAFAVIVAMFSPNVASAASCQGRPTEADIRIMTESVKEGIIENHYWYDDGTVPDLPAKVIIGISPAPVARFYGANVIVIVPETGDVSLWIVCGDKFSSTEATRFTKGDLDRVKTDLYGSFFDIDKGARTSEKTIRFEATPDFGPLDKWKEGMMEKVQNVLICLLAQYDRKVAGRSTLTLHISDFNNRSGGVLVAIPEIDEFWTVGFVPNSSGESDDVVLGNEHVLSETKEILRDRLFKHSFVRKVELKCPVAGGAGLHK